MSAYAHKQAAALTVAAGPALDGSVELSPVTEVEVSDAEVGPVGDLQRLAQGVEERLLDVIEDARHSQPFPARRSCAASSAAALGPAKSKRIQSNSGFGAQTFSGLLYGCQAPFAISGPDSPKLPGTVFGRPVLALRRGQGPPGLLQLGARREDSRSILGLVVHWHV